MNEHICPLLVKPKNKLYNIDRKLIMKIIENEQKTDSLRIKKLLILYNNKTSKGKISYNTLKRFMKYFIHFRSIIFNYQIILFLKVFILKTTVRVFSLF